jgi:hypothetical protein
MCERDNNQGLETLDRKTVACPRNNGISQLLELLRYAIGREATFREVQEA